MGVKKSTVARVERVVEKVPSGFKRSALGIIPADWDCQTVQEIAATSSNAIVGGPFGSDLISKDYVDFGIPVLRGQNLAKRYVGGDFVFVSENKAKELSANLAKPADLVFTQRGTVGQVSLVPKRPYHRYLVSQSQMKLTLDLKKSSEDFFYYVFTSEAQQKAIRCATIQTGVPHINLGILRRFLLPVPQRAEQQLIAQVLGDVDALVDALMALFAKVHEVKQAAMQALLTGKQRLPGYVAAWSVQSLGETLRVCHGRSQHGVEREGGSFPILATGGEIGRTDSFMSEGPSVLIGRKGTIDRPQYRAEPFWCVDTLFYTNIRSPNDAKFLFYRFCLIEWNRYNEASGVPSLNAGTIENIEITLPEAREQSAIAQVLTDMDNELAALEARLTKARQLKQGMMQQLLTGRIRLPLDRIE